MKKEYGVKCQLDKVGRVHIEVSSQSDTDATSSTLLFNNKLQTGKHPRYDVTIHFYRVHLQGVVDHIVRDQDQRMIISKTRIAFPVRLFRSEYYRFFSAAFRTRDSLEGRWRCVSHAWCVLQEARQRVDHHHHREILEDADPPGRPSFSFSAKGKEEEEEGGIHARFDKNIKDRRDPARRGRVLRKACRVWPIFAGVPDGETRNVIFTWTQNSQDLQLSRLNCSQRGFRRVFDNATTYLAHLTLSNNHSELALQTTHLGRAHDFITWRSDLTRRLTHLSILSGYTSWLDYRSN